MARLLSALAGSESAAGHPLLARREEGRVRIVFITSDRGLCGGYNGGLIRHMESWLRERGDGTTLTVVGRRGADYFRRRDAPIDEQLPGPLAAPAVQTARELAARLTTDVLEDRTDAVYLLYSQFRSVLSQVPTVERLIPVGVEDADGAEAGALDYVYEPNAAAVLADLAPRYVVARIARALLEAAASEHGARMTAMESATRNATELIDRLTLQMNRVRQATITKELMEIVGGAEALKG
jgi:F-type H+-transporting ATPase subunit gamma